MPLESFPRLRTKELGYSSIMRVPLLRSGRIDLIVGDMYGTPMMYKPIAAASGVVNPTAARPGIRIDRDALRNELILRGVREDMVDAEIDRINETREVGIGEWQSYSDNENGVITSVEADSVLIVPDLTKMFNWSSRYANLLEAVDEE